MLCKDLEDAVQSSYLKARTERHAFVSVENLLLALLAEVTATRVLRATGADLGALRSELLGFIDETTPHLGDDDQQTQPTMGFQRVLQRAVFHVQASGHKEVSGADVLVSIFSESDSTAALLLKQQNVMRQDVIDHLLRAGDSSVASWDAGAAALAIERVSERRAKANPRSGQTTSRSQFSIGDWIVEPPRDRIQRGSDVVKLRPRVMEVLVHLARDPSAVVSIAELVERFWPRLESGRDGVHRAIAELRRALGDDAKQPTYIETIPKRGYRLMRPVGG